MAVYLIRHAHAGNRSAWDGDDRARPLDGKGREQARHIASLLDDAPIGCILSSPATRCIETVRPLAERKDLPVEATEALAEGADADAAIDLLLGRIADNAALCAHNDLIPKMLRRLSAMGMRTKSSHEAAKGSVWVLETDGDAVVRGKYHPPGRAS